MSSTMNNFTTDTTSNPDLPDLVSAVFSQDEDEARAAFDALFALWQKGFSRTALQQGEKSPDDAIQEAAVRVWRSLREGKIAQQSPGAFRSYCRTAVVSSVIDGFRKNRRLQNAELDVVPDDTESVDFVLMRNEETERQARKLAECIAELAKANAEYHAVAYRKLKAIPVTEIAKDVGLDSNQVHRRWHTARKWLADCVTGGAA